VQLAGRCLAAEQNPEPIVEIGKLRGGGIDGLTVDPFVVDRRDRGGRKLQRRVVLAKLVERRAELIDGRFIVDAPQMEQGIDEGMIEGVQLLSHAGGTSAGLRMVRSRDPR